MCIGVVCRFIGFGWRICRFTVLRFYDFVDLRVGFLREVWDAWDMRYELL